jgi:aromatic-amino-acid transaminase
MGHVYQRAREMWSMPPDHGAAAVHIILEDAELRARWLTELTAMRDRINAVRQRLAAADPRLAYIGRQFGMFSMLPLSREQVLKLREAEAIYMADSGRFNVVGLAMTRSIDLPPPWSARWTRNRPWLTATRAGCRPTWTGER